MSDYLGFYPMADRRVALTARPPLTCPRCNSRQVQIVNWETEKPILRCREDRCGYHWKELDFGGQQVMTNFTAITERLCHRKAWTPELIYVHQTRLVLGVILGFIFGFYFARLLP